MNPQDILNVLNVGTKDVGYMSKKEIKQWLRGIADDNFCIENLIFEVGVSEIAKYIHK